MRIAIIGAGDLGMLIEHHCVQSGVKVVGFYDDYVKSHRILGGLNQVFKDFSLNIYDKVIIAIGYRHLQFKKIFQHKLIIAKIPIATFIHPTAYVDSSCTIGDGTVILPGVILDMNVRIGQSCLLNTGVTIAHDTELSECVFLAPAVSIAGFVKIGSCTNLGINTTVIDNINIGVSVRTGGGCVVISNLEDNGLYVGTPARLIRTL